MPRIVGLMEHVETSAEVQQWLMEQEEGVSVTMCGCGQTSLDYLCPFFRENLLRMRQRLMTFYGSLECTVHVTITPLYDYGCLRVIKHVHTYSLVGCCVSSS